MVFVAVYDACVLYGNTQRDLLIRVAQSGLVQAKWTTAILDEMEKNLAANRPDIQPEKLARLRALMNRAIPDVLVDGHEPLIEGLKLPDPDDRHVLAAAIKAGAQVIVTSNLKDFPSDSLAPWGLEAKVPTTSSSTRSISTTGSSGRASSRSSTPGGTRRRRWRMFSTLSSGPVSSNRLRRCGHGVKDRDRAGSR